MKEENKLNHLDRLFREQENGFDKKPSGHAWSRLEHLLDNQEQLQQEQQEQQEQLQEKKEADKTLQNKENKDPKTKEDIPRGEKVKTKKAVTSPSIHWKRYLVAASVIFALTVFGMYLPSLLQDKTQNGLAVKTKSQPAKESAKERNFKAASIDKNADLKTIYKDSSQRMTKKEAVTYDAEVTNQGQAAEFLADMDVLDSSTEGQNLDAFLTEEDQEYVAKTRDNEKSKAVNSPSAVEGERFEEAASSKITAESAPPSSGLEWNSNSGNNGYSIHEENAQELEMQDDAEATKLSEIEMAEQENESIEIVNDDEFPEETLEESDKELQDIVPADDDDDVVFDQGTVKVESAEPTAAQRTEAPQVLSDVAVGKSSKKKNRKEKKREKDGYRSDESMANEESKIDNYSPAHTELEKIETESFDAVDFGTGTIMMNSQVGLSTNITWIVGEWQTNNGSLSVKQITSTKITVEHYDLAGDLLETWTIDEDVGQMELKRKMFFANTAYSENKSVPTNYLLIENSLNRLHFQDTTTGSQAKIHFKMDGINGMTILDSPPKKGPPRKIQATRK